jgi:hypothetical protein
MAPLRCSCLCGGVVFEIPATFERAAFCHCATCKKISGGIGTASAFVDPASIRFIRGRHLLQTYQPSEGTAKTFCRSCGSNLFGGGWPHSSKASVRLSAIDSPFETKPQSHGFTRSLAPWETLPNDGLPRTS